MDNRMKTLLGEIEGFLGVAKSTLFQSISGAEVEKETHFVLESIQGLVLGHLSN